LQGRVKGQLSNRIKWGIENWNAEKFKQQKIYYHGRIKSGLKKSGVKIGLNMI
jgi:hypothetical protein